MNNPIKFQWSAGLLYRTFVSSRAAATSSLLVTSTGQKMAFGLFIPDTTAGPFHKRVIHRWKTKAGLLWCIMDIEDLAGCQITHCYSGSLPHKPDCMFIVYLRSNASNHSWHWLLSQQSPLSCGSSQATCPPSYEGHSVFQHLWSGPMLHRFSANILILLNHRNQCKNAELMSYGIHFLFLTRLYMFSLISATPLVEIFPPAGVSIISNLSSPHCSVVLL